jgi:hypothetical protein
MSTISKWATALMVVLSGTVYAQQPPDTVTRGRPPPTPTVTITASPTSIAAPGDSSTLTWSSTNATSCTATGSWSGTEAVSGTATVKPAVLSTYTLTCSDSKASSTPESATVSVVPPNGPYLAQFATHQTVNTKREGNSTVQFNTLTTYGDTIWVAATVSDYGVVHPISVTDTQGNTYTQLNQKDDGIPGWQSVAHFYASNIHGDTSTPDTVTINWGSDDYKGAIIAEIGGTTATPLVGNSANIQDGLAQGVGTATDNVTSGIITIKPNTFVNNTPAIVVGLSMNTSGGSSNTGGSGYGAPLAGTCPPPAPFLTLATCFTPVAQFWDWGLPLAILETLSIVIPSAGGDTAAFFDAPPVNPSFQNNLVTVSAVFY